MQKLNILMTGATGLIGQSFIHQFPEYQYTALTRNEGNAMKKLPSEVVCIRCLDQLKNLDEFDIIINLAGEPIIDRAWTHNQKKNITQSRWLITERLVELIKRSKNPPKVMLSGSAIGYYGNTGKIAFTETNQVSSVDFAHTLCREWEAIAQKAETHTRVCLIRTGIVLAKDGGAYKSMRLMFRLGLGGAIGAGHQFMSWIHIGDQLNAMKFLIDSQSLTGPFNLTAPQPVTNNEFTATLAKSVKRIAPFRTPALILKLLLGERSSLLLTSQRVLPKALLENGFIFEFETLEKALEKI